MKLWDTSEQMGGMVCRIGKCIICQHYCVSTTALGKSSTWCIPIFSTNYNASR